MWHWEEVDATRSGSSGDLAKLFKNEGVKEPGVFAAQPLPADAVLMAREVIQNSWDAARELHSTIADGDEIPEFRITFAFRDLAGDEKRDFVRKLGLRDLAQRAAQVESETTVDGRRRLGLSNDNSLDELDGPDPLRILEISEQGTTGMYGPFVGAKSKLYLALVSIGVTMKQDGAGGSYGYGKAGLIRGSATRTVIAYTCFRERSDDPGVTRRLLGMTYWGQHELTDTSFTGFARYGMASADGVVVPYENDEADLAAAGLDLRLRDPAVFEDLGSTFVLVEPTVDPEALCAAIERNWWPAIEGREFTAEVVTSEGDRLFPRPRKNPVLMSFIRSWEVATTPQDNAVPTEMARSFQPVEHLEPGRVGLVSDPTGWSYPQGAVIDEDGTSSGQVEHRSLVALVRGPQMVVEYFNAGQAAPFVRGTFVAHDDVDDLLRQTEPKAHDSWQTRGGLEGVDPQAPSIASAILGRVRNAVNQFRATLKPPTPRREDIRLPVLEELFKNLLNGEGSGTPPPPSKQRDVRIRIPSQIVEADPAVAGSIRLRATVAYSLSDAVQDTDEADAELSVRFSFVEDQGPGERCALTIDQPPGFVPHADREGTYTGRLGRDDVLFEVASAAYAPDWTGRLVASGNLVPALAGVAEGDSDE